MDAPKVLPGTVTFRLPKALTSDWPRVFATALTVVTLSLFYIFSEYTEKDIGTPWDITTALLYDKFPDSYLYRLDIERFVYKFANWGVFQSLWASVIAGSWVYVFRDRIKEFFVKNKIRIRSPLMLCVAPIIIARQNTIWERLSISVDIDFRYAGISALSDLFGGQCDAAVVSDAALCKYLTTSAQADSAQTAILVLPFVMISDHIRLVTRRTSDDGAFKQYINSFDDIEGKKIGYMKDSVHVDFLDTCIAKNCDRVEISSPIEGISMLLNGCIDGALFWEPHYSVMEKIQYLALIDPGASVDYRWFMCLVSTKKKLDEIRSFRSHMMYAVEAAASKCNHDSRDIVAQCLQYLHTEFTGMTEVDLNKFYDGTNARFGVMNNDKEFKHRLLAWYNVKGFGGGAGTVMKSLWYENEVR